MFRDSQPKWQCIWSSWILQLCNGAVEGMVLHPDPDNHGQENKWSPSWVLLFTGLRSSKSLKWERQACFGATAQALDERRQGCPLMGCGGRKSKIDLNAWRKQLREKRPKQLRTWLQHVFPGTQSLEIMDVNFMLVQMVCPFRVGSCSWNTFVEWQEELVLLLSIHYSNVGSFLHKEGLSRMDVKVLQKNGIIGPRTFWDELSTEITWHKSNASDLLKGVFSLLKLLWCDPLLYSPRPTQNSFDWMVFVNHHKLFFRSTRWQCITALSSWHVPQGHGEEWQHGLNHDMNWQKSPRRT